jgi:hypothetical protein
MGFADYNNCMAVTIKLEKIATPSGKKLYKVLEIEGLPEFVPEDFSLATWSKKNGVIDRLRVGTLCTIGCKILLKGISYTETEWEEFKEVFSEVIPKLREAIKSRDDIINNWKGTLEYTFFV